MHTKIHITKQGLIKLLAEKKIPEDIKNKILFNFDKADALTNKNDCLDNPQEINEFYNLMGWDKKETTQEKTPQKLQIHENPRKVGGVYGEYDAKTGGSIIYNSDKNTITKYDKNGVIIEQTDMQGNPIKTPENKPTNPTTPQDDKKTLTEEDIKNKALSLTPGETWSYQETISSRWASGSSQIERTVTWKRNDDNTLSRFHSGEVASAFTGQKGVKNFEQFETRYSDDLQTKLHEDKVTVVAQQLKTKARVYYENGKEKSEVINLENFNNYEYIGATTKEGTLLRIMRSPKFNTKEIRNKNGEIILKYENGSYQNKKGNTINDGKAYDILEKAYKNGDVGELVMNY